MAAKILALIGWMVLVGGMGMVTLAVGLLGTNGGLDLGPIWYGPGWEYKRRLLWYIPLIFIVLSLWVIVCKIAPFSLSIV